LVLWCVLWGLWSSVSAAYMQLVQRSLLSAMHAGIVPQSDGSTAAVCVYWGQVMLKFKPHASGAPHWSLQLQKQQVLWLLLVWWHACAGGRHGHCCGCVHFFAVLELGLIYQQQSCYQVVS